MTVEEYHEMKLLRKRPLEEFLVSKFGRRLKTKEVWDMITRHPVVEFKGVDARKYVTIYWSPSGNLGKSTVPFLWCERARLPAPCKPSVAEKGQYGRWLPGFDNQKALVLNEFEGNWFHGFHDFLDFLDYQYTRLMEVKGLEVNTDFEFIFINSNVNPRYWVWFFPQERQYRWLHDHEYNLLIRRTEWGHWAGCGLVEWDSRIPRERSLEQPFIHDLWVIREMEEGTMEHLPPRVRPAFPQVPGPVIPVIPLQRPPAPYPVHGAAPPVDQDADVDIFAMLARLEQEEHVDQNRWTLTHVANIPEPEDITDSSLVEQRLAQEDDLALARDLERHPFFDVEAESDE